MDLSAIASNVAPLLSSIRDLEENTQTLKRKIELLKGREADVSTQLQDATHLSGRKRKREVEDWVINVSKIFREFGILEQEVQRSKVYNVASRKRLAEQVEKMTKEAEELVEQSNFPGGLFLKVHEHTGQLLLSSRENSPAFEQNFNRIWASFQNAQSIGIYGMGGVGKTLLAKHLNDKLVNESTTEVYWFTVSQESSIYTLQNDIARDLKVNFSSETDMAKRAAGLFQAFRKRGRVVVILDDVWAKIEAKEIGIPLGMNGSQLVITSRSKEVCHQMECEDIIKVYPLSEKEAWDLFLKKLGSTEISSGVEVIAKKVAKKCNGLPLAISTMGGSLRGVTDICEWRDALEELKESPMGQEGMENDVFPVLECSFNRLRDPKLKRCFLYCSLYPEDHNIRRDELISKFICEELMDKRRSRKANFDQGHAILNKLEKACLLERFIDYKGMVCVKMHDLIRDMALRISKGKYMVKAGLQLFEIPELQGWHGNLEKISLMGNHIYQISCGISPPNFPRLSTLTLSDNWDLVFITDSLFAEMPCLRVLDLSYTGLMNLPNSVADLKKLNALLLGGSQRLTYVPPLAKLKALKELDVRETALEELPQGMESLTNLKRLDTFGSRIRTIPIGLLGRLSNLQRLSLPDSLALSVEKLEGLNQVEEFQGRLWGMRDFNRFVRSRQGNGRQLGFCYISVGKTEFMQISITDRQWLRSARLDCNKVIFCVGSIGKRESNEEKIILPSNIEILCFIGSGLSGFLLDDFLELNNNARGLKDLEIRVEDKIEGIMRLLSHEEKRRIEGEEEQPCSDPLRSLENLHLFDLPNFHCLFFTREGVAVAPLAPGTFSQLKSMRISLCLKIKKLIPWTLAQNLQNLQRLEVAFCRQIEEIIERDKNEGDMGASSSGADLIFPRLQELILHQLPELKSICKGMISPDSVEKIKIFGCTKLKKVPLYLPLLDGQLSPPPSLQHILIDRKEREWWESLEWDHPNASSVLGPFVKSM